MSRTKISDEREDLLTIVVERGERGPGTAQHILPTNCSIESSKDQFNKLRLEKKNTSTLVVSKATIQL